MEKKVQVSIKDELNELLSMTTLSLATCGENNKPMISYAPFIRIDGKFYILISRVANHHPNLLTNKFGEAMICEDEETFINPFFKKRLVFEFEAEKVEDDEKLYSIFREAYGVLVDRLKSMDFNFFVLTPGYKKLTIGPGQSYFLGNDDEIIEQNTGLTKGHNYKKDVLELEMDNKKIIYPFIKYNDAFYIIEDRDNNLDFEKINIYLDDIKQDYGFEKITDELRVKHIIGHMKEEIKCYKNIEDDKFYSYKINLK